MSQTSEMANLRDAFPNLNPSTIQDVYNARNGNVQATFDTLLMISGPQNQVPPPPPPWPQSMSYSGPAPSTPPYLAPSTQFMQQGPPNSYLQPPQSNLLPSQPTPPSPQPNQQTGHAQSYFTQPSHSPQPSPGLYPQRQPSPYGTPGSHQPQCGSPALPDMSSLSLGTVKQSPLPTNTNGAHFAECDGCGTSPIRGIRWRCLTCPDEDLCNHCKESGVKRSHRFEQVELGLEQHRETYCDGCPSTNGQRYIIGTRYQCMTHNDEDFCEPCVKQGRACNGKLRQIRSSPLARHLEKYSCVPMPNEWIPLLQPKTGEYHFGAAQGIQSWRDTVTTAGLVASPRRQWVNGTPPPSEYTISVSDQKHKFAWKLTHGSSKKELFTFKAKFNSKRLLEDGVLTPHHGKPISLNWQHTSNSDSLSFTTGTGMKMRWVTNGANSNLNGNRFDLVRHALFAQQNPHHSSQESIIADYTDWDGHPDDPCECLTMRTRDIDPAIIVASYLAALSYEIQDQQLENREHADEIKQTEELARSVYLGYQTFWYASDYVDPAATAAQSGMSSKDKLKMVNNGMKLLTGGLKIATAVMGAQGG